MADHKKDFYVDLTLPYSVNNVELNNFTNADVGKALLLGGRGFGSTSGSSSFESIDNWEVRAGGYIYYNFGSKIGYFPPKSFLVYNEDDPSHTSSNMYMRGSIAFVGGRRMDISNQSISVSSLGSGQTLRLYLDEDGILSATGIGGSYPTTVTYAPLGTVTYTGGSTYDYVSESIWLDGFEGGGSALTCGNDFTFGNDVTITNDLTVSGTLTGTTSAVNINVTGNLDVDGTTDVDGLTSEGNITIRSAYGLYVKNAANDDDICWIDDTGETDNTVTYKAYFKQITRLVGHYDGISYSYGDATSRKTAAQVMEDHTKAGYIFAGYGQQLLFMERNSTDTENYAVFPSYGTSAYNDTDPTTYTHGWSTRYSNVVPVTTYTRSTTGVTGTAKLVIEGTFSAGANSKESIFVDREITPRQMMIAINGASNTTRDSGGYGYWLLDQNEVAGGTFVVPLDIATSGTLYFHLWVYPTATICNYTFYLYEHNLETYSSEYLHADHTPTATRTLASGSLHDPSTTGYEWKRYVGSLDLSSYPLDAGTRCSIRFVLSGGDATSGANVAGNCLMEYPGLWL
jgi:hypothetical protein